jgi:hypothetical protein
VEKTGGLRKLHCHELHKSHFSLNIVRLNKPEAMIWPGHRHGGNKKTRQVLDKVQKDGSQLQDLCMPPRIGILQHILNTRKCGVRLWTGFILHRLGPSGWLL